MEAGGEKLYSPFMMTPADWVMGTLETAVVNPPEVRKKQFLYLKWWVLCGEKPKSSTQENVIFQSYSYIGKINI